MIDKIHIKNFKSILDLKLDLGRFNVIIGSNGSGKTNILEAITLASIASQDKLDMEFLANRDVRMPEPQFMFNAFSDVENDENCESKMPFITVDVNSKPKLNTNVLIGYAENLKKWINLGNSVNKLKIKRAFERYEENTGSTLEILHDDDFDILDLDKKYPDIFNKLNSNTDIKSK